MNDLERELSESLVDTAELLDRWVDQNRIPPNLRAQGAQVAGALRVLSAVVQAVAP